MSLGEKIYTALLLCFCILCLLGSITVYALFHRNQEMSFSLILMLSVYLVLGTTMLLTTILNLRAAELKMIPSVIQIVLLCLTLYFIPLATWGIYLLRQRVRKETELL